MRGRISDKRQGDVPRARWHIDQEKIRLVPPRLGHQLLDRLVQHGAAPDDRLRVVHEVPHRETAHAVHQRRYDGVTEHDGIVGRTQHLGQRETVNVGVKHSDGVSRLGERDGEVHRHRGLADAALARRDSEHPRFRETIEELRRRVRVIVTVAVRGTGHRSAQKVPQSQTFIVVHRAHHDHGVWRLCQDQLTESLQVRPVRHGQHEFDPRDAVFLARRRRGSPAHPKNAPVGVRRWRRVFRAGGDPGSQCSFT